MKLKQWVKYSITIKKVGKAEKSMPKICQQFLGKEHWTKI